MPGRPCAALGSASLRATPGLTPATGRSRRAPRAFKDVEKVITGRTTDIVKTAAAAVSAGQVHHA
jgi:hypothetical protein